MRAAMALALLLGVALAGCSSSEGGDAPTPPASVITDPRDLLNGTAPGSHIHDYWGGRDRVPVLDVEGSAWSQCSGGCQAGMDAAEARPDEGVIIPQGTRWVNGTFSFAPHAENHVTTYELWVKTAADGETKMVQVIQPGERFSIESSRDENDPPHYVLSLWRFEIVAKTGGDVTFRGDYSWDVEAIRGLPLEPFPPHPDAWGGATEIDLLQDDAQSVLVYSTGGSWSCYAATRCPGSHPMPDGVVVPYDADRVEVRLGGNVVGLALWYHGADTWSLTKAEGQLDAVGSSMLFVIPLDGQGDSPYASQSLWELVVNLDDTAPAQAWSGSYTITAKAFKE